MQVWVPPLVVELKFNVNGASRGKPGPARVGGVLRNSHGVLLVLFSKHVGCMRSMEVELEVVVILEALLIFSPSFHAKLVVESIP